MAAWVRRAAARLRRHGPELAIALAAAAIGVAFAATALRHARPLALPLDEAYAYLACAGRLGRGEPCAAGSASALWAALLAPAGALGAPIWVVFGLCAALYAATCVGCYRLVQRIAGGIAGLAAAALVLGVAPLAARSLAGIEVALASALLVAVLLLLARAPREGPPPRALAVCLALAGLARPEAAILAVLVGGAAIAGRLRARDVRAAAWWAAPLVAPVVWLLLREGAAAPPGEVGSWSDAIPLPRPRLAAALWLAGALRVLAWASRERRWAAGALVVAAPLVLIGAAIASGEAAGPGAARALAPAIPLVLATAACALAPGRATFAGRMPMRIGRVVAAAVLAALWWSAAVPAFGTEPVRHARAAAELDAGAGRIGRYLWRELPGASILADEAGAIAYHGGVRASGLLGAGDAAAHGPGAIFEWLEGLPPRRRPTHLVFAEDRPEVSAFAGAVVLETWRPRRSGQGRGPGGALRLVAASWDHAGTAERPLDPHPGWRVVDRVDVADLAAERGHRWRGELGRHRPGDPPARRTLLHREVRPTGLALDGGRTIRGGAERFTIEIDPARPVRLVLRTGGHREPPGHEALAGPVTASVSTRAGAARAELPPPAGAFVELALDVPMPGERHVPVRVAATGPYRVFHWFVLQPD